MATGFIQRFKGKIVATEIYFPTGSIGIIGVSTVTNSTVTISPTALASLIGGGVPVSTLAGPSSQIGSSVTPIVAYGITNIPDTTINSTYYLADPIPGVVKYLVMTSTVTSSGTRSVATFTTGVGFYGSSMGTNRFDTLNFGSSKTIASCVEMLGMSSTSWLIVGGGYNASTVPLSTTAVTLSTRT